MLVIQSDPTHYSDGLRVLLIYACASTIVALKSQLWSVVVFSDEQFIGVGSVVQ